MPTLVGTDVAWHTFIDGDGYEAAGKRRVDVADGHARWRESVQRRLEPLHCFRSLTRMRAGPDFQTHIWRGKPKVDEQAVVQGEVVVLSSVRQNRPM